MPTLYVRNVPPALYESLRSWAAASGRSVNAEVLALLEQEGERRRRDGDWFERFLALRREIELPPDAPRAEELIRRERDAAE